MREDGPGKALRRVAVTGAHGFIGRETVRLARESGFALSVLTRALPGPASCGVLPAALDLHTPRAELARALAGHQTVLHLAGMTNPRARETVLHAANAALTEHLAEAAAAAGVRRFVYVSSLKVHGEGGIEPYTAASPIAPLDAYGRSKRDAELALADIAARTGMELAVVRPPLVLGPGAKGNIAALSKALRWGMPLPLGGLGANRRSLIGLRDLAALLLELAGAAEVPGLPLLVHSPPALSTRDLVLALAQAHGLPPRLFSVAEPLLRGSLGTLGLGAACTRLCGSLWLDDSAALARIAWRPRFGLAFEWARMAGGPRVEKASER